MMQAALSVFVITLALGQIISTSRGWRAASLVGPSRLAGYGLGVSLLALGALFLPNNWQVLWWTILAAPLALGVLLLGGSYIGPPPQPDQLLVTDLQAHSRFVPVQIPDGDYLMPGYLLLPSASGRNEGLAVCIVPGAGDHKTFFKWRLVQALLAEGLTVLTIDTPGHGDYRQRPMTFPDCLSAFPAAINFLREQPGIRRVGLIGISLGGALAIRGMVENEAMQASKGGLVDALVVLESPVQLDYSRSLLYQEAWASFRAPVLSLLREISVKQIIEIWYSGGYVSSHSTSELIDLLNPVSSISRIKDIPLLLAYGNRDPVAPPATARAIRQAAPLAETLTVKNASHVTLTLMPEVNQQVARWLKERLSQPASDN